MSIEKPTTPDAAQKEHDAQQMDAAKRYSPRAARRGYDPQIARQIAQWGD